MPVWWGTFAYMIIMSTIGMVMYKNKVLDAQVGIETLDSSFNFKSIGLVFSILTFIPLIIFSGYREGIFDTQDYQYAYNIFFADDLNQINDILSGARELKGPLFYILLVLFKHVTHGTYNDWFMLMAIFQGVSLALFFYRYSFDFRYSIFLFFATAEFLWMFNGIRQFLAATLVLYFVHWIEKRKTIPFIVVVIIAYFIHSSAIFWIPVYFIVNYEPWSKKFIILSIFLTAALFIYSRTLSDESDYSYLVRDNSYKTGINPIRIIVMAIPSVIAFIKRDEIKGKSSPFINQLINMSVIVTECYIVGMFTSGVIGRLPIYFILFNWLLLPWLIKNFFDESMSKFITLASIIGYMGYFCYDMYIVKNGIYHSLILDLHYWNM